jgi:hypothetical protein|tara:strand:+ start:257 stop:586 length:330 start_codon:yes stop_codon:yes gene_type:complete
MPNTFKLFTKKNIGTADSDVYTCPSSTQTTIIGLNLANTKNSLKQTTVKLINNDGDSCHLIKSGPVPVGGALVVVGGDQKVVMNTNDKLRISADDSSCIDVALSILEIT